MGSARSAIELVVIQANTWSASFRTTAISLSAMPLRRLASTFLDKATAKVWMAAMGSDLILTCNIDF